MSRRKDPGPVAAYARRTRRRPTPGCASSSHRATARARRGVSGMAHVQDLWEKTVSGRRVRTSRYGQGNRWQARYLDPDGRERTRTFERKQDAERFVVTMGADVLRGAYVDPNAGKVTFAQFAE